MYLSGTGSLFSPSWSQFFTSCPGLPNVGSKACTTMPKIPLLGFFCICFSFLLPIMLISKCYSSFNSAKLRVRSLLFFFFNVFGMELYESDSTWGSERATWRVGSFLPQCGTSGTELNSSGLSVSVLTTEPSRQPWDQSSHLKFTQRTWLDSVRIEPSLSAEVAHFFPKRQPWEPAQDQLYPSISQSTQSRTVSVWVSLREGVFKNGHRRDPKNQTPPCLPH